MPFDVYIWQAPRDLDDARAADLLTAWEAAGADPAASPFESSTDIGWFYRELADALPGLGAVTDAVPSGRRTPVWASGTDESPARLVAVRLSPARAREELDEIASLAAKYDLTVFDPRSGRLSHPLDDMAAYASATFWPRGAIRAAVAGALGLVLAIGSWIVAIPVLTAIGLVLGGFLFVLSVATLIHEGRVAMRRRRAP